MKPNELKIGNYVMISKTFEIVRVATITRHTIGYHRADGEALMKTASLKEIEPLEINQEIIEAFGLHRKDSVEYRLGNLLYDYEFRNGNDYIGICKAKDGTIVFSALHGKKMAMNCIIESVSELQQRLQDAGFHINATFEQVKNALLRNTLLQKQLKDTEMIIAIEKDLKREHVQISLDSLRRDKMDVF